MARDVGFRVGGGLTNMSIQLEIEMEGWIDLILGVRLIERGGAPGQCMAGPIFGLLMDRRGFGDPSAIKGTARGPPHLFISAVP